MYPLLITLSSYCEPQFTIRRFALLKPTLFLLLLCLSFNATAETTTNQEPETISNNELQDFNVNSENVKTVINLGLDLAGRHLHYQYGSANPTAGAMDCSGTMYYMLNTLCCYFALENILFCESSELLK